MANSKIARGDFRNPCPDLKNPAAKTAVDSLLSTVKEAHERFGDPTAEDHEIASLPLEAIQERIVFDQDGLTVTRVLEARIRLTIQASLATHCLTAFPYERALEEAADLDRDYDYDDPQEIIDCYPLYGLIFSVKDCIHVEGLPTTLGCSSRAGHNESATAQMVQEMIDAGAVMIAKTTAPQLMMSNTTQSPLWGTTRSPLEPSADAENQEQEFQVGGSSGGEASLVSMGGSHIGIGTDMGGSVRQPACLNELYGYKFPSQPRKFRWKLPTDFMTGLPHTTVPATAPGLLAKNFWTLKAVADHLNGAKYENVEELTSEDFEDILDEWAIPVPEDLGNNPRIVYTAQQSSPELQGLMDWLVGYLRNMSYSNRLAHPDSIDKLGDVDVEAWGEVWTEHAKEHGFDHARAMLGDDPLIKRTLFDESRLSTTKGCKADDWRPDSAKLEELKKTFLRQAGLDGPVNSDEGPENVILLTPTYVLGGPVQNKAFVELDDAGLSEIWCQIFNLLDWPAVSICIPDVPRIRRSKFRQTAADSPKWAKHLPGHIDDGEPEGRLPHLSVQLATYPGNELALLDYADRLCNLSKWTPEDYQLADQELARSDPRGHARVHKLDKDGADEEKRKADDGSETISTDQEPQQKRSRNDTDTN
uniref:amidase n=2 Tax=Kalmanozyma brasiliensis (strain GHG001) TaxID=1365824 RepID=V5EXR8_KALBG